MKNKLRMLAALALLAVIAACAALLGGRALGRLGGADLTAGRLYTLSDGTKRILAGLNRPVTLKLYYSREVAKEGPEGIRFWNNYFFYVRDLLRQYAAHAGGNLQLEIIDPKPYSDEEENAIRAGLQSYGMRGESFLFGLLAETELGKQNIIPFFEPRRQMFVEYDVSKLLSDLTRRQKSEIGVVSSLPLLGDDYPPQLMQMLMMQGRQVRPPWLLFQELRQTYNVENAKAEKGRFTKKFDYVMVIHPKKLDAETLFALDQYVMEGGRLLVFTDPFSITDPAAAGQPPMMRAPNPAEAASDLNALLKKWGAAMEPGQVAVSPQIGARLQLQRNRPPEQFLPFLALNEKCFNPQVIATSGLKDVRMVIAGVWEINAPAGVTAESLLYTPEDGNTWVPGEGEMMNPPSAHRIIAALDGARAGRRNLAVLLRGKFASNYPDGIEITEKAPEKPETGAGKDEEKKVEPAKKIKLTARAEAAEGAMVLAVSDVDMLSDQAAYQDGGFGPMRQGEASALVQNLLEYMGGEEDLISIRTRGEYLRPLTEVQKIENAAEKATAAEVEALNAVISAKQKELQDFAGRGGGADLKLLKKEIIEKRREIEAQIRASTKELRQLQQARRDSVKKLENNVALVNILAAPALVLLIGLGVWLYRRRK